MTMLFRLIQVLLESINELVFSMQRILVGLKEVLKSRRWLFLACVVFLLCISPVLSQGNPVWTTNTINVSPGEAINVSSNIAVSATKDPPKLKLTRDGSKHSIPPIEAVKGRITTSDKPVQLEFISPASLDLGEYTPTLSFSSEDGKSMQDVPINVKDSKDGKLQIIKRPGDVTITSVTPENLFPTLMGRKYSFTVNGDGFSTKGSDNKLIIAMNENEKDNGQSQDVCWRDKEIPIPDNDEDFVKCVQDYKPVTAPSAVPSAIAMSERQLRFDNIVLNHDDSGKKTLWINIRAKDKISNAKEVRVSKVPYAFPILLSAFFVACITAAIWWLIAKGTKKNLLHLLLLDKETKTYSLQRLQFYLWTLVALLSYLFLLFSRNIVQGGLDFINIPSGLPGILLISAATSFFSIGITEVKGSPGSAETDPQWSDLISTGGYVVPDRVQFLVWTIVGVIVYAFIVLFQNPAKIGELPTIPDGFLQLSGVSSLGYLGGKLARSPGPVITNIGKVGYKDGSLALSINGSNLSKNASFELFTAASDNQPIRLPQDILFKAVDDKDATKATIEIEESEPKDNQFAKILKLSIPSSKNLWPYKYPNTYKIVIYNPDGGFAAYKFYGAQSASDPTITNVAGIPIKSNTTSTLTIDGTNFVDKSNVEIVGKNSEISATLITKYISSTQLTVSITLTEAADSEAYLTVVNPDGTSSLPSPLTITP